MTATATTRTSATLPDLPFPLASPAERGANQRLRLLMETLSAASPDASPRGPSQASSKHAESPDGMGRQLRLLVHQIETRHADLLEMLARFDEAKGWQRGGARNCVTWMNAELGICRSLAREKLRAAHALRKLPWLAKLFSAGRLGWSKIRALTRVATPDTEQALAATALDMNASAVVRMCEGLRMQPDPAGLRDERVADAARHARRSLTSSRAVDGNTVYRLVLTAERAAQFEACLQRIEERLFAEERVAQRGTDADRIDEAPARPLANQRRADALFAMANASVGAGDTELSAAPRPQVTVTIDADVLAEDAPSEHDHQAGCECHPPQVDLPLPVRAVIQGSGAITAATAQRISCDADILTVITSGGEPLSIGRRQRAWPAAMVRAITARDEVCQFPGCDSTRFLQVHHLVHWAHGGETSVSNGCLLCSDCHRRVHEEHWRITRRDDVPDASHQGSIECNEVLESASALTQEVARRLNRHRPRLHFERARRWPTPPTLRQEPRGSRRDGGQRLSLCGSAAKATRFAHHSIA